MTRYVDRRSSIKGELQEIQDLVDLADGSDDLVVRGHLSRLAVIRMSGFIESSLRLMVNGYLAENSSYRVLRFAQGQVGRMPNLNPEKLEQVVASFDDSWRSELTEFLSRDERRQGLANLIGARHTLAHGGSTAVSTARMHDYMKIARETVDFLETRFLPLPGP
jgi:hypothetical protein